jgi:hypothetical protein
MSACPRMSAEMVEFPPADPSYRRPLYFEEGATAVTKRLALST